MKEIKLSEEQKWYLSAVEGCLVLRGMTKEQAAQLIEKYQLIERIAVFPSLQLHYDVEVTADEILSAV